MEVAITPKYSIKHQQDIQGSGRAIRKAKDIPDQGRVVDCGQSPRHALFLKGGCLHH